MIYIIVWSVISIICRFSGMIQSQQLYLGMVVMLAAIFLEDVIKKKEGK